ncbi:hypothetical protein PSMK_17100 [Phycisphaera mikurensis NBRC 102666]|uniref:Uncharacterized protein n=2 Tax=Phycisphaera TaxID=666508 RepID=I0IF31_PHYMF|nr:hypothetical protein PSMK_17100 [Phycisphaera mikurensis NBRC 102666]
MGLAFEAPVDFAAVRNDLNRRAGRLVMVDRRRQRLQLTWSALPAGPTPDAAALARDWRKRVEAAAGERGPLEPPPELRSLEAVLPADRPAADPGRAPVRWSGWIGDAPAGGTRTDAVAAVGGLLVDAVLLDPRARGRVPSEQTLRLLASAAPATLPGNATRWTAFGLDAAAPPGWAAASVRHTPAASVLAFTGPGGLTARFWRRGMASAWFGGDAAALLGESTPPGLVPVPAAAGAPAGAVAAAGPEPCRPWARLAGRARLRRDLLWHDAAQQAVLGVTVRGPRRAELPDPAGLLPPA